MNQQEAKLVDTANHDHDLSAPSRGRTIAVTLAAVWLQAIVIIYVVLQIERVATPFSEWLEKIKHLLGV